MCRRLPPNFQAIYNGTDPSSVKGYLKGRGARPRGHVAGCCVEDLVKTKLGAVRVKTAFVSPWANRHKLGCVRVKWEPS